MIDRPVTLKEDARITVNASKIQGISRQTTIRHVTKQISCVLLDICDISLEVFIL